MSILNLLARYEERGVVIKLADDKLNIDAPKGVMTPALIGELKDRKSEIVEFLRQNVRDRVNYSSIEPVEEKEYYALSSAQTRLYFLQQMDPGGTSYHSPMRKMLGGEVSKKKLEESFKKLIMRHESLRTSFLPVEEEPVQKIHKYDDVDFKIEYHDISTAGEKAGDRRSPAIVRDFVKSFDLSRAPLLRVGLIKTAETEHILLLDMHHIIMDGTSTSILYNDFMKLFQGEELAPLKLRYRDFSSWQNHRKEDAFFQKQHDYWKGIFSGELPVLKLPTDYPRPLVQDFEGNSVNFVLNEEKTRVLKNIVDESGATLYIALLAVFTLLLSKLGRREDIVVGTPIANRRHVNIEGIVGMIANTLPMRNFPIPQKTFNRFLGEVKDRTLKAYENQDCQFEDIIDSISVQRDAGRNPLFDVMLNVLNQAEFKKDISKFKEGGPYVHRKGTAKFDLNWAVADLGKKLFINVEYSSRLFKPRTVERFIECFKQIVDVLGKNKNIELAQIEIVPAEEKRKILSEFNGAADHSPAGKTIHRLFEEQAEKNPYNNALRFQDIQLTYGELNIRSNRLAGLLRSRGVTSDHVVGLAVERSVEIVVGMLGIMKANGAYLPIDPGYPGERKKYMLRDSGVNLLLTNYEENQSPGISNNVETIDISDQRIYTGDYTGDGNNPGYAGKETDLVYLIYTSGSTGRPKGAMLEHRNLVNLIHHQHRYTNLDFSRVLQLTTISFDVSFQEIFSTLAAGGMLVLIKKEIVSNIPALFGVIEENHIRTLFISASFLKFIGNESEYAALFPACIDHIAAAGEQLVLNQRLKEYLQTNRVCIHNHYGPSEAHVVTALTIDPRQVRDEIPTFPSIGKPLVNTNIYIVDKGMRLQPVGIPGELLIGGIQVGRGYWGNNELTSEKFVPNPFLENDRLYKTGDIARWHEDGNIEYMGRLDNQVKIRGFRIETGEIESQLLKHEDIKDAVVLAKERNGTKFLCAYFAAPVAPGTPELRDYLARKLPDFMVPSYFIQIEKMPLTPSGKIDRNALPEPDPAAAGETGDTAPKNEIEKKLAEIWAGIFGINEERIGSQSNFFDLGGNSLNLLSLVSKIEKEFGERVPVTHLYNKPVLSEIAKLLFTKNFEEEPVVLLNRSLPKKIFCFPPQIGYGLFYFPLSNLINDYSFYAFSFIEDMEQDERLREYADIITRLQPDGPYILFGYSSAGGLTFQVAKTLEKRGKEVSDIIFFDCFYVETHGRRTGVPEIDAVNLPRYYRFVNQYLERLEATHHKEKFLEKSNKYMNYFINIYGLEPIRSNVHLILSEEVRREQRKANDPMCWKPLTTKNLMHYNGFGDHQSLFEPGFLEKNAGVMRGILDRIESRKPLDSK